MTGLAGAQQNPADHTRSSPEIEEFIEISADHVEQDAVKNVIRAKGRVVIRYQNNTIRADRVKINNKTGVGEASGHVLITGEGTQLKTERATFHIKSQKAIFFKVQGKIAKNYFVKGKKLRRLSKKHYKLTESSLTTCQGKFPDWLLQVGSLDIIAGDRALFRDATFKIKNFPVFYLPIGYVPLDNKRKSGLLMPDVGTSNTDGTFINNSYFWAINQQSDATFYVDYLSKRGVRPGVEYRYAPSATTAGEIRGTVLDDDVTGNIFWKIDGTHKQILPYDINVNAKLDLRGDNNFDKTFNSVTAARTRRSTNSFLNLTKRWGNSSLDVLTRFRNSTQDNRDDTLNLLPQVTHKIQRISIGNTPFYFNQEAQYTLYQRDLNPDRDTDDSVTFQRFDIHPQISLPYRAGSWLSVTPTVGFRETYYSKGFGTNNERLDGFSRELFDVSMVAVGPSVDRTFNLDSAVYPKIKHIIEPRATYNYIPDTDEEARNKIKPIDGTDTIQPQNRITYSIIQRLLRKKVLRGNDTRTDQILRFEIMQSYDIREASRVQPAGAKSRPFSDLRFDLDSRPFEFMFLNFDTTFNVYDSIVNTFNFELGVQPTDKLSVIFERRFTRNATTFIRGTIDLSVNKGWHLLYSARYDERRANFQENNFSLMYDDPCKCWSMGFDFIKRNNINRGIRQDETKFMFNITLRGIGGFGTKGRDKLIHRTFPSLPNANF